MVDPVAGESASIFFILLSALKRVCPLFGEYSHVVGQGNLPVLVANDRELKGGVGNLIDVLDPATV